MHMAGNVKEWTADDLSGGKAGAKILRGGSWSSLCEDYGLLYVRRWGEPRTTRAADIGFRCAADAEKAGK
jgi:formylglycine-generating enzyme required for sulfatase activity